ncbi:MAG: hypothetical protein ACI4NA_05160 [Succinivibrio sp.]
MLELLFLLLPVAAFYGYFMGRGSARLRVLNRKSKNSTAYLKGVEYLLSDNHEKAVDNFISYLNATDPTFETRLALGNLLRQRGDTEKAIALHEKMASEGGDEAEQELCRLELSRDCISAGVFDRAEELLKGLVEIPRQRAEAARLLMKVYERESDFRLAVEVVSSYRDVLGDSVAKPLANYYCELGSEALDAGENGKARDYFQKALKAGSGSVRPHLMMAELCIREGRQKEAVQHVKDASAIDRRCGMLCLDCLKRCFTNKADPAYRFALEDLVHRTGSASVMCELVRIVAESSGQSDAESMAADYLRGHPSLRLFSELIGLRSRSLPGQESQGVMQLKSIIDAQVVSAPRYVCARCGFESSVMFWQCPSCRRWESLNPRNGIDGD